jgi:hypothetical protein
MRHFSWSDEIATAEARRFWYHGRVGRATGHNNVDGDTGTRKLVCVAGGHPFEPCLCRAVRMKLGAQHCKKLVVTVMMRPQLAEKFDSKFDSNSRLPRNTSR